MDSVIITNHCAIRNTSRGIGIAQQNIVSTICTIFTHNNTTSINIINSYGGGSWSQRQYRLRYSIINNLYIC